MKIHKKKKTWKRENIENEKYNYNEEKDENCEHDEN